MKAVLILVLVEYPFGDKEFADNLQTLCLNPCFSGISFRRRFLLHHPDLYKGLNPCFSGISFRRSGIDFTREQYEAS